MITLPTLNVAPIQQGLKDLGDAMVYQQKVQDAQDEQQATLAVRQQYNDKLQELQSSGDFSQDWGSQLREWAGTTVDQQASLFKNPQAFQAFRNQTLNHFEDTVPVIRQQMTVAQQSHNLGNTQSTLDTATQKAQSGDLSGVADWRTIANPQASVDPATKAQSVDFSLPFKNAFGNNVKAAQQFWQQGNDQIAGTYIGARIDGIMNNDQLTSSQKLMWLQQLRRGADNDLQSNGVQISTATQAKLEQTLNSTIAATQKAAYTETETQQLNQLDTTVSQTLQNWTGAKATGASFVPESIQQFAKTPGLLPSVQAKANEAIERLTMKGDGSQGAANTAAMSAANQKVVTDKILGVLSSAAMTGADGNDLHQIVNQMYLDPNGYKGLKIDLGELSNIQSKADSFTGMFQSANKDLIQFIKSKFTGKGISDGESPLLISNALETIGGFNTFGTSKFKDATGAYDMDKVTNLINTMATEHTAKNIQAIVSAQGWWGHPKSFTDDDAGKYVSQVQNGAGLADFNRAKFPSAPGQPIPDPIVAGATTKLQAMFNGAGLGKAQDTAFNLGNKMGLPVFQSDKGTWYEPSADASNKITWTPLNYNPRTGQPIQSRK